MVAMTDQRVRRRYTDKIVNRPSTSLIFSIQYISIASVSVCVKYDDSIERLQ